MALLVSTIAGGCGDDAMSSPDATPDAPSDASVDASASDATADGSTDTNIDTGPPFDGGMVCAETSATEITLSSGMAVLHRAGQSYVQWRDREEGEAGADIRYRLYRADAPITSDNLESAQVVASGILNHSGQLFGGAFIPARRLDTERAMAVVEEGREPLPLWSGLWVATTQQNGCAYYAVLATDLDDTPIEAVMPGVNATTEPVAELLAQRTPIMRYHSDDRGQYWRQTRVTGTPDLPLRVELHASNAQGGGAGDYGDYYNYFADTPMGYQDGLPGVFAVEETHTGPQYLRMRNRDTIVRPDGSRGVETHWFGYVGPDAETGERFAHPYTEARLLWMIPWVIERYGADPERVYGIGNSMGAWGTLTFSFRHPELFAAVYANRPRFYQGNLASIDGAVDQESITLPDGTRWIEHHNSIAFVEGHPADLPFLGWNVGRHDGFASWEEQLDMVEALEAGHHGFAFAWNDGDHSSGTASGSVIQAWYPQEKFARNLSYPAFANSSINNDLGDGDPADGDLEGGINLGFDWSLHSDTESEWHLDLRNALAEAEMTVDVTPRRLQRFRPEAGERVAYVILRGGATLAEGEITADAHGLVTLPGVSLLPDTDTTIRLTR